MLVLILSAAAALFAGSYTYAMAAPVPRDIPTAVVPPSPEQAEALSSGAEEHGTAFVSAMDERLGSSLDLRVLPDEDAARRAVEEQEVFAVLQVRGDEVELGVASAAGASVARLLTETAPQVGDDLGVRVPVHDLKPLQSTDPQGLAVFYISLAAVIIGFVGAIQLSVHASALSPPVRIAFTAGYAALGGFAIAATVDWGLGALRLPFPESWAVLSLTMFASGMVFTMFNTLIGRWAMLPTWGVMVLLGNPSSGGAVSWPLLPHPLGELGRWLPPGASISAQHTAIYFPGHQHALPFLVLGAWALAGCAVFWTWRHRHPGGRRTAPAHAA
ncbi:ABC-2 transporter permease [Nocardiopsis baichengensis]|uniref:hypothetical protein n=1 Tax=Nocardiopsis baichengensis TaxID=280240 RepID=UPI00034DF06A|nr:hypothetical protein [Nocardiopsis baichengensis]